jgi:hypothetical protein
VRRSELKPFDEVIEALRGRAIRAKSRPNDLDHVAAPGLGVLLSLAFLGASQRRGCPIC